MRYLTITPLAKTLLFLPGAAGNLQLWQPVSDGLSHPGQRWFISWPGFGGMPSEPGVSGMDDLVARVLSNAPMKSSRTLRRTSPREQ